MTTKVEAMSKNARIKEEIKNLWQAVSINREVIDAYLKTQGTSFREMHEHAIKTNCERNISNLKMFLAKAQGNLEQNNLSSCFSDLELVMSEIKRVQQGR